MVKFRSPCVQSDVRFAPQKTGDQPGLSDPKMQKQNDLSSTFINVSAAPTRTDARLL
jgi:hypothetical protein